MVLTKYKIGELIEQVAEKNSDMLYGENDVYGMTITKELIPTKANVSSTDLSKFLVVGPNEFVYNPRTHGKHIGLGYNNSTNSFLISWNNTAFRVKKSAMDKILPEYLFLHFNRTEWDREACVNSWGSSTEVFSWDSLCGMELELPAVCIQKKYVDVYEAMLANQKYYEFGVEDLKRTCEIMIDRIKHDAPRVRVDNLLENVDERNTDGTISSVNGININKEFMLSLAKVDGNGLKRYKLVRPGQFAYSGMQTGRDECIRITLNQTELSKIVSPAYSVLGVKSNDVMPEYIMQWFSRSESDRYGWFASDASVRANLDLDRFLEIEIPLPDKRIQKSIADIYKVYKERQHINERLKLQLKDICPVLIKGSREEAEKGE